MKYTLTISSDNPSDIVAILSTGAQPAVAAALAEAPSVDFHAAPQDNTDDDGPADANAPERDVRGFPWDERIHSTNKGVNKDGTWRYKRNTDKDLIAKVEAELKNEGGTATAPAPAPSIVSQMPVTPPLPIAPPAFDPTAAAPTPVAPTAANVTYPQVIEKLTSCFHAQKIDQQSLGTFWRELGIDPSVGAQAIVNDQAKLNEAFAKAEALLVA